MKCVARLGGAGRGLACHGLTCLGPALGRAAVMRLCPLITPA
jgi:hypothetical protein